MPSDSVCGLYLIIAHTHYLMDINPLNSTFQENGYAQLIWQAHSMGNCFWDQDTADTDLGSGSRRHWLQWFGIRTPQTLIAMVWDQDAADTDCNGLGSGRRRHWLQWFGIRMPQTLIAMVWDQDAADTDCNGLCMRRCILSFIATVVLSIFRDA